MRFVGTGERGDRYAEMLIYVSEVEAPIETEVSASVDCGPYDGEFGWVWNPQSAIQELARFEVERAPVPFDIRCTVEFSVPSAPQRDGEDTDPVIVAWEATLELVEEEPLEGELNARVDIDAVE